MIIIRNMISTSSDLICQDILLKIFNFYYKVLFKTQKEKILEESSQTFLDLLSHFLKVLIELNKEKEEKDKEIKTEKKEEKKSIFSFSFLTSKKDKVKTSINEEVYEYEDMIMNTFFDFIDHTDDTFIIYNFLLVAYTTGAVEIFNDRIEYIEKFFVMRFKGYPSIVTTPLEDKLFTLLIHIKFEWDKIQRQLMKDRKIYDLEFHDVLRLNLGFSILAIKSIISYSFAIPDKKKRLYWMMGDEISFIYNFDNNNNNDINNKEDYCELTIVLFKDILTLFTKATEKEEILKADELIFSCFEEISKHPNTDIFNSIFELKDRFNICCDYIISKVNLLGLINEKRINTIEADIDKLIKPLIYYHKNHFIFYFIYIEIKNADTLYYAQLVFNRLLDNKIEIMLVSDSYKGNLLLFNIINLILLLEVLSNERKDIFHKLVNLKFLMLPFSPLKTLNYIYSMSLINTDYNEVSPLQPKKLLCEFMFDIIINLYLSQPRYEFLDIISTQFFEPAEDNSKFSDIFQRLNVKSTLPKDEYYNLKKFKTIFFTMDHNMIEELKSKQKNITVNNDYIQLTNVSLSLFFLVKIYVIKYKKEEEQKLDLYLNLLSKVLCFNIDELYEEKLSFFKSSENILYKKFRKTLETDFIKLGKKKNSENLDKLLIKLEVVTDNILANEDKDTYIATHPSYSCMEKNIKFNKENNDNISDKKRSFSGSDLNEASKTYNIRQKENDLGRNSKFSMLTKVPSKITLFSVDSKKNSTNESSSSSLKDKKNDSKEKEREREQEQEQEREKNNTQKEPTNVKKIKSFQDFDINSIIYSPKQQLILSEFSSVFRDIYFNNEAFIQLKNYYLSHFTANRYGKQLRYPSKLRNFSNNVEPPIFLKQNFNFFNSKYFSISHSYFTNLIPKIHLKEISLFPKPYPNYDPIVQIECELIKYDNSFFGHIKFYHNFLSFQTSEDIRRKGTYTDKLQYVLSSLETDFTEREKTIIFHYSEIDEVIIRRFIFIWQAIEIFLKNGKSFYFNFFSSQKCKNFFSQLKHYYNGTIIEESKAYFEKQNYHQKWLDNEITNYDYLLLINKFSSRSFKDVSQYPIFPWLLKDYGNIKKIEDKFLLTSKGFSDQLDKKENNHQGKDIKKFAKGNLRLFEYPLCCQNEEMREIIKDKFIDSKSSNKFPYGLGNHYSTGSFIFYYFMRAFPFSNCLIKLQNGRNENPNRMFLSIEETYSQLNEGQDNREIIPEFFTCIEFMLNLNCCFYGYKQDGEIVDDLYFFKKEKNSNNKEKTFSLKLFVNFLLQHRKILNSIMIVNNINSWIDWVFGVNQITNKAETCNTFSNFCYESQTNLEKKIEKKKNKNISDEEIFRIYSDKINIILNFGQTPHQLFEQNFLKKEVKVQLYSKYDDIENFVSNISIRTFITNIDDMCFFFNLSSDLSKLYLISKSGRNRKIQFYETYFNESVEFMADLPSTTYKKLPYSFTILHNKLQLNLKEKEKQREKEKEKQKEKEKEKQNEKEKQKQKKNEYNFPRRFENYFIEMHNSSYLISCNYDDNTFKIQSTYIKSKDADNKNIFSVLVEDYVQCIAKIDDEHFVIGLRNGKLIKFNFIVDNNDKASFELKEEFSFFDHEEGIQIILIDKRLNIIVTYSEDNTINIRKLYDFELLTYITINEKEVKSIRISNVNLLYVLCYIKKSFKSIIYAYTLTGIKFAKKIEDKINGMEITQSGNIIIGYSNKKNIKVLKGGDLTEKGEVDIIELLQKNASDKDFNNDKKDTKMHIISFKFILSKQNFFIAQVSNSKLITIQIKHFEHIVLFS